MNRKSPVTVGSAAVLSMMSEGLKLARRSRRETIQQAADRVGLSPSSIKRLESGDPYQIASAGAGAIVNALCSYGYGNALAEALKPEKDEQGDYLRRRAVMMKSS
jgi:transcriptional regulator with XRE-family HTH domain